MESTTIETLDGLALRVAHHPADAPRRGTVLLAHGIGQDMDEGGMFDRVADALAEAGFDAVRFTFRGHGDSDGESAGATVAGERLDFERAFGHAAATFEGPYFALAKSFGAVATCLSLDRLGDDLSGVVLWNPVLDVEGTFLDPSRPWGRRNFTDERVERLRETGRLGLDGRFEMGSVLWDELHRYDPGARFRESPVPALVVHGDEDDVVPYEDARRVAEAKGADFHTVAGADHGFRTGGDRPPAGGLREHDRRTVDWFVERAEG